MNRCKKHRFHYQGKKCPYCLKEKREKLEERARKKAAKRKKN